MVAVQTGLDAARCFADIPTKNRLARMSHYYLAPRLPVLPLRVCTILYSPIMDGRQALSRLHLQAEWMSARLAGWLALLLGRSDN